MLRVPGSAGDLLMLKSRGADVRVVYSPIDCLKIARANPDKKVVFFAIGFETTAPANAMAVWQAKQAGNQELLHSRFACSGAAGDGLDSAIAAQSRAGVSRSGHVCTVMGYREYEPIAARFKVPIVITGFEPLDILEGVLMTVRQLEAGTPKWKTNIRALCSGRKSRRAGFGERGLRSLRPQMARRRFDPEERLQTSLRVSRARRRATLRQ